nr:retrovirus-related Pol polyprotein from transposon TNT 1-94 [Tanacetum cinerariifolium]
MTIIGTKWVFRDKLDENGVVSQNKARLVAQGFNQQEGIDYDEIYAPVARLESIRILLAYACALDFKLFQMDVKSAFLNGFINKEVYVAQPPGFIDFKKPDHVYKLKKALYGLKQTPKAWYDRLKAFLIKHEYKMRMVDNTLFTKKKSSNLIIVQIYVDDIIFGLTCQDIGDEFAKIMHDEFKMSMMGALNFFFGLQIKQMEDGIFFNQSKYIKEILKKFDLEDSKPMKTPMSFDTKLMKDEELSAFVPASKRLSKPLTLKRLSVSFDTLRHYALRIMEIMYRKSTSGIFTFMGCYLTSWFSKKQTALAISMTEAEYVSAEKACQQALWMKQALIDYDNLLKFLTYLVRVLVSLLTSGHLMTWHMVFLGMVNTKQTLLLLMTSFHIFEMIKKVSQQERKTRKDYGTKRGRHYTSSSFAVVQPSSSHLNDDDDNEGTLRASTPSPTRFVNSLTNDVPRVFYNPPNIDPPMEPFYTRQTEIINRQV